MSNAKLQESVVAPQVPTGVSAPSMRQHNAISFTRHLQDPDAETLTHSCVLPPVRQCAARVTLLAAHNRDLGLANSPIPCFAKPPAHCNALKRVKHGAVQNPTQRCVRKLYPECAISLRLGSVISPARLPVVTLILTSVSKHRLSFAVKRYLIAANPIMFSASNQTRLSAEKPARSVASRPVRLSVNRLTRHTAARPIRGNVRRAARFRAGCPTRNSASNPALGCARNKMDLNPIRKSASRVVLSHAANRIPLAVLKVAWCCAATAILKSASNPAALSAASQVLWSAVRPIRWAGVDNLRSCCASRACLRFVSSPALCSAARPTLSSVVPNPTRWSAVTAVLNSAVNLNRRSVHKVLSGSASRAHRQLADSLRLRLVASHWS